MRNNAIRAAPSEKLQMSPPQNAAASARVGAAKALRLARNGTIQCCYTNGTQLFQIIRMATAAGSFLEKTVLPQTRVCFKANPQDHLEVHTGSPITSVLADRIPCEQLACLESWSA